MNEDFIKKNFTERQINRKAIELERQWKKERINTLRHQFKTLNFSIRKPAILRLQKRAQIGILNLPKQKYGKHDPNQINKTQEFVQQHFISKKQMQEEVTDDKNQWIKQSNESLLKAVQNKIDMKAMYWNIAKNRHLAFQYNLNKKEKYEPIQDKGAYLTIQYSKKDIKYQIKLNQQSDFERYQKSKLPTRAEYKSYVKKLFSPREKNISIVEEGQAKLSSKLQNFNSQSIQSFQAKQKLLNSSLDILIQHLDQEDIVEYQKMQKHARHAESYIQSYVEMKDHIKKQIKRLPRIKELKNLKKHWQ